jgi:hypothetical protein
VGDPCHDCGAPTDETADREGAWVVCEACLAARIERVKAGRSPTDEGPYTRQAPRRGRPHRTAGKGAKHGE